ncbi:MAG: 1-hydroxycarotenoid 3,4-desaturase CrtD [Hyphomicrobiaceae bacterium]
MPPFRVAIVGAGIGGLSAAAVLAARGAEVTVYESAARPGGKMRQIEIGGLPIDAGPTVFTMRWVFDELFAATGHRLDDLVRLLPVTTLARHAWNERERLDLYADTRRSADAIAAFAGPGEARGYLAFCEAARRTYTALQRTFLTAEQPSMPGLVARMGMSGLRNFTHANPMASLWSELGRYFKDPRLRQLFGRYATYVGSSPFEAPATLMLIAHVEQDGVWLVEGGMHRIAAALAAVVEDLGGRIHYGTQVAGISTADGAANGVVLADGERIAAEAVVFNGDAAALAKGLLGAEARRALPGHGEPPRSLSAMTWVMRADASGFPLLRHSVFFSQDYQAEFAALVAGRRMPDDPTVYICAQDRTDQDGPPDASPERLLCLINAPATGDSPAASAHAAWFEPRETDRCLERMTRRLAACGLSLDTTPARTIATTPRGFDRLFPGSGGALYGRASHGWMASFQRPGARTKIKRLYLAGGSVHPGAGVPMAALSGRLAAESLLKDRTSPRRYRPAAMPGGTSTG